MKNYCKIIISENLAMFIPGVYSVKKSLRKDKNLRSTNTFLALSIGKKIRSVLLNKTPQLLNVNVRKSVSEFSRIAYTNII